MSAPLAVPSGIDSSTSGAIIDSDYAIKRTAPSSNALAYPSPQEWEAQKSEIGRLYLDEEKSLKQVMEFMAQVHGHHGT